MSSSHARLYRDAEGVWWLADAGSSTGTFVGKVLMLNDEGQIFSTGTAWAVAPGVYATNGHIAAPVKDLLETGGAAFIAINKEPTKKYRVRLAIPHPAYGTDMMNAQGKEAEIPSYDVGLLIVKEQSPVTFALAPADKARQLDSGKRVAYIGFPTERLIHGGSDSERPVATMQTGIITAVTDYWGSQADVGDRLLVQHNLPCTGGASGSPIFDQNGEVVAVLCAGNISYTLPMDTKVAVDRAKDQVVAALKEQLSTGNLSEEEKAKAVEAAKERLTQLKNLKVGIEDLKRAPSAALINFAQRVDILQELLEAYRQAANE